VEAECEDAEHWNQSIVSMQQGKPAPGSRSTRQRKDRMIPVRLLHAHEIGEGLFPVAVPVIRAGAVEAGVDQDGEVFQGGHGIEHR
jgi:hypothetical protein